MEEKDLIAEEEASFITLTDENGVEAEFEFMECIEYQGKEYIVLLPADEESAEVVILEVVPVDEENEDYVSVEDMEVLEAVYAIFKDHFKDVLTFED